MPDPCCSSASVTPMRRIGAQGPGRLRRAPMGPRMGMHRLAALREPMTPPQPSADLGAAAAAAGAGQRLLRMGASGALAAALLLSPVAAAPGAQAATDAAKVGTCLLSKCQGAMARCVGDPTCLQNLVCLNLCSGTADETACQIRCGDRYADKAIDTFNACAVSEQKCVPQRADQGTYPVPPDCALDRAFDLDAFQGRWYISAGLNELFDTFPCQEHIFAVPQPGNLVGKLYWRIPRPGSDFVERSTIQTFKQVPDNPALLLNHDNEYLHYQDDWYILSSSITGDAATDHVFVYYRGTNDAWDGYGGAVIYTRAKQLPAGLVSKLAAAADSVGLDWGAFKQTDNSCRPRPPRRTVVDEVETGLEDSMRSFGKGFTVLEDRVAREVVAEEKTLARELAAAEDALARVEQRLSREAAAEEATVERELSGLGQLLARLVGLGPGVLPP